jgi:hypothetical protein
MGVMGTPDFSQMPDLPSLPIMADVPLAPPPVPEKWQTPSLPPQPDYVYNPNDPFDIGQDIETWFKNGAVVDPDWAKKVESTIGWQSVNNPYYVPPSNPNFSVYDTYNPNPLPITTQTPTPMPSPTLSTQASTPTSTSNKSVKNPNRDIVNLEPELRGISEQTFILFNQISGTELINLVRHDTVSGKNVLHSLVSDLEKINLSFDPSLILTNKASYQSIFNGFQIKLAEKIPSEEKYSLNDKNYIPEENLLTNAYWDGENLVIEVENLRPTELLQIEIEMDGRIYKVRENDYQ